MYNCTLLLYIELILCHEKDDWPVLWFNIVSIWGSRVNLESWKAEPSFKPRNHSFFTLKIVLKSCKYDQISSICLGQSSITSPSAGKARRLIPTGRHMKITERCSNAILSAWGLHSKIINNRFLLLKRKHSQGRARKDRNKPWKISPTSDLDRKLMD